MDSVRSEGTLTLDWGCYTVAAGGILYLLVRHALLLKGRLKPDSLACGDCTKATCAFLKDQCLCGSPPVISASSPRAVDSKGSQTGTGSGTGGRPAFSQRSGVAIAPIILYGTFGCLFFYTLFCIERSICYMLKGTLAWIPFRFCAYCIPIASNLYLIAKSCMYTVFVARLQQGFQGSLYTVSHKLIKALYASVAVYNVGFCALYSIFVRGKVEDVNKSLSYCEPAIPGWMLSALVLFDVVFVATVVYLFVNRLSKMYKDFSVNSDEKAKARYRQENADMLLLPLKYTILSTAAVLSTMAGLMLMVLAGTEFVVPFDCALNGMALVLMTSHWAPVYKWLCSPLLRCVSHTPWLPCTDLTEVQLSVLMKSSSKAKSMSKGSDAEVSGVSGARRSRNPDSTGHSQGSQLSAVTLETSS